MSMPFIADLKKGNAVMRFQCMAADTVVIHGVEYLPKGVDDEKLYGGPTFDELDSELQDSFHEYLAESGVDDTVASFIALYADYKEQQEYTKWLTDMEASIANPKPLK